MQARSRFPWPTQEPEGQRVSSGGPVGRRDRAVMVGSRLSSRPLARTFGMRFAAPLSGFCRASAQSSADRATSTACIPGNEQVTSSEQRAIKAAWLRLGLHASPKQVVEALEEFGVEVSEAFVGRVRGQMSRERSSAAREQAKRPPSTKSRKRPQQRKIPGRRG